MLRPRHPLLILGMTALISSVCRAYVAEQAQDPSLVPESSRKTSSVILACGYADELRMAQFHESLQRGARPFKSYERDFAWLVDACAKTAPYERAAMMEYYGLEDLAETDLGRLREFHSHWLKIAAPPDEVNRFTDRLTSEEIKLCVRKKLTDGKPLACTGSAGAPKRNTNMRATVSGEGSALLGEGGFALGGGAARGADSVACGKGAVANSAGAVAIGENALAQGNNTCAVGERAFAYDTYNDLRMDVISAVKKYCPGLTERGLSLVQSVCR